MNTQRIDWQAFSDEQLLAQCQEDRYRASGPGGQKRNKIESAVRLRHQPTDLIITASESRSQHDNRRRALRRLREALAFQHRQTLDKPPETLSHFVDGNRLDVSVKSARFLPLAALVLDLLAEENGSVSATATQLGVTTANLVSFFRSHRDLWKSAQEIRAANGLKPLR